MLEKPIFFVVFVGESLNQYTSDVGFDEIEHATDMFFDSDTFLVDNSVGKITGPSEELFDQKYMYITEIAKVKSIIK